MEMKAKWMWANHEPGHEGYFPLGKSFSLDQAYFFVHTPLQLR